jgi:hypothetical protein
MQHVHREPIDQLCLLVPEHSQRGLVDSDDAAILVRCDDGIGHTVDNGRTQALRLNQVTLGQLFVRDVAHRQRDAVTQPDQLTIQPLQLHVVRRIVVFVGHGLAGLDHIAVALECLFIGKQEEFSIQPAADERIMPPAGQAGAALIEENAAEIRNLAVGVAHRLEDEKGILMAFRCGMESGADLVQLFLPVGKLPQKQACQPIKDRAKYCHQQYDGNDRP